MSGQDTSSVREYFERDAERFDAIYDGTNRGSLQAVIDRLFRTEMLQARNSSVAALVAARGSIVDVGCGSGRSALAVAAAHDLTVHGIDLSPRMIEMAREAASRQGLGDRCTFEVADVMSWDPPRHYDGVLAVGLIDYFDDPSPLFRRFAELAPGGYAVVAYPHSWMLLNGARRAWLRIAKQCSVRFYSERDLERIAAEVGGRVSAQRSHGPTPLIRDGVARIELP